ncbi:MAG: tRNA dihydrouridine synthase DusB [bacterium]|nr:tRNA dihydrouridine synthase DusB [bacterium]MDT8395757.1 tRNA dihydrouridine synthase DusB [bacterium]
MIKPLNIGNIRIENPLILAPLAGITNLPFRVVCRMGGAGLVWSEMISSRALHFRDRRTNDMIVFDPGEHPVAAQIFGRDPGEMADAARLISEKGADIIDINMGCPVKKILKSGSGVQLMREPDLARSIVREVVKAAGCPVTVKFRLGWSESEINFLELGKVFEEEGAAALVLHPRTRMQGFTGAADIQAIGKLVEAVTIPVVGSGGVSGGQAALSMISRTGCAGVMIGRAALGKPWIFDEIHAYITGKEKHAGLEFRSNLVQKHIELLLEHLPGHRSVGHLRKHLAWYSKGFGGGAAFRREINRLLEPHEIVKAAEDFFSSTF